MPGGESSRVKHAEEALSELREYIHRQDVPPNKSTRDANLRSVEKHLEAIVNAE